LKTPAAGFARGLIAGAILAVLALITIAPLREAVLPPDPESERIDEALGIIESSYFRETDQSELEDASISGMVNSLRKRYDDRFSHYFDAKTYRRFSAATSGEFSGVGMTVSEVKRGLRVANVYEDTPAEGAGIEMGDFVVAVEGESIAGDSATATAARIKGPPGTEVTLTVVDGATGKRRELTIERASVRIPAVEGEIKEAGGKEIAYVQFSTFSRGAHGELRSEIEGLYREGAEGLVLDIRGNGGGLLEEAVLVTSLFQESGPVVTTEGRSRPEQTLEAVGDALDPRPMVVLTNGDTASASEILAAALQQKDLATLVGTTTFGKGVFQEVIELESGAALDLTVGEYLTADGTSILGKGVEPDVEAPDDDLSDGDRTLRRGLDIVADEIAAG
jgi:carboxyl-terminal processing protease